MEKLQVKNMIEIIIAVVISVVVGAGGMYFLKPDENPDKINKSKISDMTKLEASKSSMWANCMDAQRTGKGVGQNIRDCAPLLDDITMSGKLKNFEACIKLKRQYPDEAKQLDCKTDILK
ncbi:MAG: hypothetical protein ABIJ97_03110 [Bacteroidota bacterium]